MNIIQFNETKVYVKDLSTLDQRYIDIHGEKSCPLCGIYFKVGDGYALVANNYKLFPNIGVHTNCFKGEGSINQIFNDYQEYKIAAEKYKHWM